MPFITKNIITLIILNMYKIRKRKYPCKPKKRTMKQVLDTQQSYILIHYSSFEQVYAKAKVLISQEGLLPPLSDWAPANCTAKVCL